jgi:hypothetical protein
MKITKKDFRNTVELAYRTGYLDGMVNSSEVLKGAATEAGIHADWNGSEVRKQMEALIDLERYHVDGRKNEAEEDR